MPTATTNAIGYMDDFGQVEVIAYPTTTLVREKADTTFVTKHLQASAIVDGLIEGEVSEAKLWDFIATHMNAMIYADILGYRRSLVGQPVYRDWAVRHFARLVEKHHAVMDFAYRMKGLDPLEGESLPVLFGNPMFSYEENGHVCGSALWDHAEDIFTWVMNDTGFTSVHEATSTKGRKPAKKNAKRKAASKARKASKKK
jgi:hypothetical protein